jgi:hypothetical protein
MERFVNIVWFIALMYTIMENVYFGWNLTPKSDAELICDGICALLFSMAYMYTKRAKS